MAEQFQRQLEAEEGGSCFSSGEGGGDGGTETTELQLIRHTLTLTEFSERIRRKLHD